MDLRFNTANSPAASSDFDQMAETPQRGSHHRRSQSDTSFRFAASNLEDLLSFDAADLDFSAFASSSLATTPTNGSAAQHGVPILVDSLAKSNSNNPSSDESSGQPIYKPGQTRPPNGHLRSLSMDSDFFEGLSLNEGGARNVSGEKRTFGHRHSNSMDGLPASFEEESALCSGFASAKKAMGNEKLAELALIDPKRARRILANRQSAARSKERKTRYTNELERKVHTLQNEATTLSAQVTLLQRDTTDLTSENKELKFRLQALEQQAKLRDALNEHLREELQHLKIAAGRVAAVNGNPFNRGLPPQFPASQQASHQFQNPQSQQPGTMSPLSTSDNQPFSRQPHPNFMDFNQRT